MYTPLVNLVIYNSNCKFNKRYISTNTYLVGTAKKLGSFLIPLPELDIVLKSPIKDLPQIENLKLIPDIAIIKEVLFNVINENNLMYKNDRGFAVNITACDKYGDFKSLTCYHKGIINKSHIDNVSELLSWELNNKLNNYQGNLGNNINFIEYNLNIWVVHLKKNM